MFSYLAALKSATASPARCPRRLSWRRLIASTLKKQDNTLSTLNLYLICIIAKQSQMFQCQQIGYTFWDDLYLTLMGFYQWGESRTSLCAWMPVSHLPKCFLVFVSNESFNIKKIKRSKSSLANYMDLFVFVYLLKRSVITSIFNVLMITNLFYIQIETFIN